MTISFILLLLLHVFLSLLLIGLVLLQNDKGGGLAGALGGMGGGAAFTGGSTATFITKLTTWVAMASFVVILFLNVLADNSAPRVQSELKGATSERGLSTVIPGAGSGAAAPSEGIPGLDAAPRPQTQEQAPSVPAGESTKESSENP